jgi:hypothetical protein
MESTEALNLIESMIKHAKKEIKDNGFYYMFWGYLVFFSALTDYSLLMLDNTNHALVWAITMPFGGLISAVKGIREAKQQKVITYIDEMFKYLMIAFTISLVIVCFIMPMTQQNWRSFFPTLMVIYAFALFVSGGMLRFIPLRIGALAVWGLGALSYFLNYDQQLLCMAAAVVSGFIIPGHLLNRKFKQDV